MASMQGHQRLLLLLLLVVSRCFLDLGEQHPQHEQGSSGEFSTPKIVLTSPAEERASEQVNEIGGPGEKKHEENEQEHKINVSQRGGLFVPTYGEITDSFLERQRTLGPRILAEDVFFKAENHGSQVLVHTLLATNLALKEIDVSWVTQLTSDRLDGFKAMMARWKGPISATLYCRELQRDLDLIRPLRDRVDFHLVLADLHPGRLYPVNTLRNLAMDKCRTQWMVLVDADFVPNDDVYDLLLPRLEPWGKTGGNEIYVLPAFQMQDKEKGIPRNKMELLSLGPAVSQVHPEKGRDIAHKYTDYERWRVSSEIYEIQYRMPYEPYYVANKRIPRYESAFVGYGNDKTGQCYEVWRSRMKYKILPDCFVFHMDHPRGDWLKFDTEWIIRGPSTLETFLKEVHVRYTGNKSTPHEAGVNLHVIAGEQGESCEDACLKRNLSCRAEHGLEVNDCERVKEALGGLCEGSCSQALFGNDLPAFNHKYNMCLVNQKPGEYPLSCRIRQPDSNRVCPCGEKLEQWLTEHWVEEIKNKSLEEFQLTWFK
uniref:Glycosyltransferase family 18 catalytic domain-containing protein n=1 Tax=Guillardia theta TaxID=55529 RepID=A0A7S4PPK2_GUITH|mmetsp:Transcript_780/g.2342  ORF Transcript_780/g.2342 Transcript_780/m.2342 type:complete len:541 (+) Transcript_780:231-1853(+)